MTTATKYKIYPKYKSSGIEWIEKIPSDWECEKIKYVSKMDDCGYWGADENQMEINAKVATTAHITMDGKWLIDKMPERSFSKLEYKRHKLKQGDIVVVKSSGSATNIISGKAGYVGKDVEGLVFSNFLLRISTQENNFSSRYLYYFLTSYLTRQRIERMVSATTYPNLKIQEYFSSFIPYPKLEQQKKILDFLDHQTEKIDEVVAKKQKLIELFKEKRQALITHAVTKGLDPKAKMKPSGIDWLGDIPSGWDAWKVAHLFNKIGSGTTPPSDDMDYYEGDIPWVITGELKDNEIFDSENKVTKKAVQELSALKIFPKDSLLIAMYGATIGKMAILRIPATTNQACCVLGDSKLIDTDFSFYYFLSFRPHLIALSYGGGQPNISQDTIRSIKIFLPVISEQKKIADFLDRETAKIDEMVEKVESQIEKLQEYRQVLITSAVTGKIMVN